MTIWFDMDGTIANLYGVENWLPMLLSENAFPYTIAKPMLNMSILARYLNKVQSKGIQIGIISWGSKNSSQEYLQAVQEAKKEWLKIHLKSVTWDSIKIVEHGTPKNNYCVDVNDILFDDELNNRNTWSGQSFEPTYILEVLKTYC